MKLKEKLAYELLYQNRFMNEGMDGHIQEEYCEMFLLGFERAREMARDLVFLNRIKRVRWMQL